MGGLINTLYYYYYYHLNFQFHFPHSYISFFEDHNLQSIIAEFRNHRIDRNHNIFRVIIACLISVVSMQIPSDIYLHKSIPLNSASYMGQAESTSAHVYRTLPGHPGCRGRCHAVGT